MALFIFAIILIAAVWLTWWLRGVFAHDEVEFWRDQCKTNAELLKQQKEAELLAKTPHIKISLKKHKAK